MVDPGSPPSPEAASAATGPTAPTGPPRPGGSIFTIEGRAAPALFVVGWLATLVGLGGILVGVMAGGRGAALALVVVGLVALSIGLVAGAGVQSIERRARGAYAYTGPSPFNNSARRTP